MRTSLYRLNDTTTISSRFTVYCLELKHWAQIQILHQALVTRVLPPENFTKCMIRICQPLYNVNMFQKQDVYLQKTLFTTWRTLECFTKTTDQEKFIFNSSKLLVGLNSLNLMTTNQSVVAENQLYGSTCKWIFTWYRTYVRHWICSSQDFRFCQIFSATNKVFKVKFTPRKTYHSRWRTYKPWNRTFENNLAVIINSELTGYQHYPSVLLMTL